MSQYKFEGKTFENFHEVRQYAKEAMIGRHQDDHSMIMEWQEEGFWEPCARVEFDKTHNEWRARR